MANYTILLRHGESYKNVKDKHGGEGTNLTNNGIKQINNFINYLKDQNLINQYKIYHSNKKQVFHTAQLLSELLNTSLIFDERINPLYLGALDDLSTKDALELYPEPASLMECWRRNEIEIIDLVIPNAENLFHFWDRGVSFINYIKTSDHNTIIVGTRSILTLLLSILLGRSIKRNGGYKNIDIPLASYITFQYNLKKKEFALISELTNLNKI